MRDQYHQPRPTNSADALADRIFGPRGSPQQPTVSAAVSISPTGSPFTYTSPGPGAVIMSGGTVSLVEFVRAAVATTIGLTGGMFPVARGDSLKVTYLVAPTMKFVPM